MTVVNIRPQKKKGRLDWGTSKRPGTPGVNVRSAFWNCWYHWPEWLSAHTRPIASRRAVDHLAQRCQLRINRLEPIVNRRQVHRLRA